MVITGISGLLADWHAVRAELAALDREEHQDLTDHHGRTWTWLSHDIYVHDGCLAWPRDLILDGTHGLPRPGLAADNPNYAALCATCRREDT